MKPIVVAIAVANVAALATGTAWSQAPEGAAEPERSVRVFTLENAFVGDAAETLQSLTTGSDGVTIVPYQSTNTLFVRANDAALEQIEALVQVIDKPPATIVIDVTLLELYGVSDESLAMADFAGDLDAVDKKIAEREAAGSLKVVERIQLTTLDNQIAQVNAGAIEPVVRGFTRLPSRDGRPQSSPMTQMENTGSMLTATSRVSAGDIVTELAFEKSSASGIARGKNTADDSEDAAAKEDDALPLGKVDTLKIRGTLRLSPEKVTIVGGRACDHGDGVSRLVLLASARVTP